MAYLAIVVFVGIVALIVYFIHLGDENTKKDTGDTFESEELPCMMGLSEQIDQRLKHLSHQIEGDLYTPTRTMGLSEYIGNQIPAREDVLEALNSTECEYCREDGDFYPPEENCEFCNESSFEEPEYDFCSLCAHNEHSLKKDKKKPKKKKTKKKEKAKKKPKKK